MGDSHPDRGRLRETAAEPNHHRPPELRPAPSALPLLRLLAVVGTAVTMLWHATSVTQIKPRQELGFIVLLVAGFAVGATLWLLLPAATRTLLRHKDLLLPLGLLIPGEALLSAMLGLPALAALLAPAWSVKLLSLGFSLSLAFLVRALFSVVYAGWTTTLVVQAVAQDRVDPIAALTTFGRWSWRTLVVEFIGWGVLMVASAVAIVLGAASIALALILIGLSSLIWNLATAALLPVALSEGRSFADALRAGFRTSWSNKSRWAMPVIVQMVLLGWVTFFHISYAGSPQPGSTTTHTKTDWSVNGFWTGGYENDCRWHTQLMKVVEAEPLQLVNSLLGLLFAVLAIGVKLKIVTDLDQAGPWTDQPAGLGGSE